MMTSAAISLPERVGKLETRVDGHDRDIAMERQERTEQSAEVRKDVSELQRTVWKACGAVCATVTLVPIVLKFLKL